MLSSVILRVIRCRQHLQCMAVDEYVRYYAIVAFHTTYSVVQHIAEGYYLIQLCIPLFFSDNQYNNIFSLIDLYF